MNASPVGAGHPSDPLLAHGTMIIFLTVGAVLGLLLSLALGPKATLAGDRSGDPRLVSDVEAAIGDPGGLGAVSVARLADGSVTYAGLGRTGDRAPTPQTPYELGSITKTFTGMLLADAVERREVQLSDPVAAYVTELASTPAGASTLQQLATHTSGLPTLPPDLALGRAAKVLRNLDPDAEWTTERVIRSAKQTPVGTRGKYAYSNLGMSLLGHALARGAGVDSWQQLAQQRLFDPLGMTSTTFLDGGAAEPAGLAQPHRASGWPAHTWTSQGFAPAGASTRTTAQDMMRFARAVVDGKAPGRGALKTTTRATDRLRIGLAWHALVAGEGSTVVWHNGGTRTMLAVDLKTKEAVLVLNSSSRSVDGLAVDLLVAGRTGVTARPDTPPLPVVGLLALGVALLCLVSLAVRAVRSRDRVHVLTGWVDGVTGAVLAVVHGPWSWLPGWLVGVLAGLTVGFVVVGARRLPGLPTWPERRRVFAVIGLVLDMVVFGLVVVTA